MNKTYESANIQVKAYAILRAHVRQCLLGYELNPTQWALIGMVADSPDGVRLVQVANVLGIKPPLVTVMVDDLIDRDIVNRIPHHLDKRAKLLIITATGKKLFKKVEEDLTVVLKALLNGITEDELNTYHKVLLTIIKNGQL